MLVDLRSERSCHGYAKSMRTSLDMVIAEFCLKLPKSSYFTTRVT